MTAQDGIAAGMDQTRLTAEEQAARYRAEQAEATRQRLARIPPGDDTTGQALAAYLGLDATPGPGEPCGSRAARVVRLATGRPCETCRTPAIQRKEAAPC